MLKEPEALHVASPDCGAVQDWSAFRDWLGDNAFGKWHVQQRQIQEKILVSSLTLCPYCVRDSR